MFEKRVIERNEDALRSCKRSSSLHSFKKVQREGRLTGCVEEARISERSTCVSARALITYFHFIGGTCRSSPDSRATIAGSDYTRAAPRKKSLATYASLPGAIDIF